MTSSKCGQKSSRGTSRPTPPLGIPARAPDAVVVAHHIDALGVRQVAVLYEQAEDAPAAEFKLLSDDTL